MATKIQYLTYYVVLTDPVEVAALQAQFPTGRNLAVVGATNGNDAVTVYNAPYRGYIQPASGLAPFTWTPWKRGALPGVFPLNVRTFERTVGGFWGFFGTTTRYYWMAKFQLAGTPTPIVDGEEVEQVALAQRRWAHGWDSFYTETGAGGGNPEGGQAEFATLRTGRRRGNSRHVGGGGITLTSAITVVCDRDLTEQTGGGASAFTESWERIYIRPRVTDITSLGFWSTRENATNVICSLQISAQGVITFHNGAGATLLGISSEACIIGAWNKVDILMQMNTGGGSGRIRLYVKGVLGLDVTVPAASAGLGTNGWFHASTRLGVSPGPAGGTWQMDIDDWINAAFPSVDSGGDFVGADWLFGSSVRRIMPRAFAASHSVNWTGDVRILKQGVGVAEATPVSALASSTALAKAAVTTDFEESVLQVNEALGIAAISVGCMSRRGAASGRVGFNVNGAGEVYTNITEINTNLDWNATLYRPSGLLVPQVLTALELLYEKGNSADAATLGSLLAHAELIGIFGDEDIVGAPTVSLGVGTGEHNAPYGRSSWAQPALSGPISPYIAIAGTYVGNGTGTTLQFKAPINFFITRPVTPSQGGGYWWSSMIAAHQNSAQGPLGQPMVEAREDQTFVPGLSEDEQQQRYQIDIAGNDADWNALGVTYSYLAISDPGMRFMCNGGYHHVGGLATPQQNPLPNANFLPEWMWLQREEVDGSSTVGRYIKGPGHAAATINLTSGVLTANAITFATGRLDTQTAGHFSGFANIAFSCWRRADGNADPGQADVVAMGTYIGDGVSPRVITPAPASLKRPLWVWVQPETASGVFRDPAHTGTISAGEGLGADIAANGISAGAPGSFTVGSQLNTNLAVYHYFVLWGSTTAGNGGFSPGGEFVPVEPNSPADGPWPDDPPEPTDPDVSPIAGEPDLDVTTEVATDTDNVGGTVGGEFCEVYTRELVNLALGHIGISKEIANLVTEQSEAAAVARKVVRHDVNRTLRDFPWDFATRYENLVLHSGTSTVPVNNDWQFAYEAPNAMMLARRISKVEKGRRFDQDPVPFREGLIDGVPVIYCNAEASVLVPLVLEFTVRIDCPAFYGDALFREALTWKFAASFAQSLSRDSEKQKFAIQMYDATLHRATSVDAKESQQEKPGDADWISGRN